MPPLDLLLVDDEPQLVRALTPSLAADGYAVTSVGDGAAALEALRSRPFEVVLLDLGLPDLDGQQVLQRMREWSDVPIVVLSARDMEQQKIDALDAGANDYVSKPFALGELMARLRAARRGREQRGSDEPMIVAGPLRMDLAARDVRLNEREVRLTPREYALLKVFARRAGAALTYRQIIGAVWGGQDTDLQAVRVLVGQLRQKLEAAAGGRRLIRTEPGVGYRLLIEDQD